MRWSNAILMLGVTLAAPAVAAAPDEIHWTIMGQTAVTFDWRGTDNQITYGTEPGVYTTTVTAATPTPLPDGAGPFWEARLTGLLENQLYYYRIGTRPEHTFRTPPPRGSSGFWFAEEADVGATLTYPQVKATQDSMAVDETNVADQDAPAFALVVGDLTYGDQDGVTRIDQHFNDVMSWSENSAYMPAWGNHEWDPAGSVKLDQVNNYKGRFDLPNPQLAPGTGTTCIQNDTVPGEDWYWFDYGNVRFICYPPGSEGTCGYSGARAAWKLSAGTLMSAVDNDPQIKFIVTFGHFPPYSSGTDFAGDASRAADMVALHAAHPKYVLNVAGHSHHYERFDPAQTGGVLQIIGPGGGSTLGGLGTALPSTVVRFKHLEHMKIHVSDNRIDGYTVCGPSRPEETTTCTPGTLIDTWSVVAADTTPPTVTVTSPVGGEGWTAGTAHAITWTATDDVAMGTLDLALSTDGGTSFPTAIATGIANSGTFQWTVPASFTTTARVRVTARDATGHVGADSSHANFAITGWVVTASAGAHGTIAPDGATEVADGDTPAYTITPDAGYHVSGVLVNGVSVGAVTSYTFPAVHANQSIAASFAGDGWTLTIDVAGSGSVAKLPDQPSYAAGATVQLTAVPAAGWAFTGWSDALTGTTNPADLLMDANKLVTATFADTAIPVITLASPDGGELLVIGSSSSLTWSATDNVTVSAVDLLLSRSGPTGPFDAIATGIANSGSFSWTVTSPATTDAFVKAVAHDPAGNTGADISNAAFTIGTTTGVAEGPILEVALSPVRPNPARGSSRFGFALPHDASVHLGILDVQGRERAVLADGPFAAGRHFVLWAGASRRDVVPGLYFLRLSAAGRTIVRRFALIR